MFLILYYVLVLNKISPFFFAKKIVWVIIKPCKMKVYFQIFKFSKSQRPNSA
jgi:hypothetical protein